MHTTISHEFVDVIPGHLDEGILYICIPYTTAVHKCFCGCGHEVVTPLAPRQWSLIFDGETISLTPSIGNWSFPCRSHYWIRAGECTRRALSPPRRSPPSGPTTANSSSTTTNRALPGRAKPTSRQSAGGRGWPRGSGKDSRDLSCRPRVASEADGEPRLHPRRGVAGTGLLDADTTIGVTGWGLTLIAKVIRPLVMGRSYTGSH